MRDSAASTRARARRRGFGVGEPAPHVVRQSARAGRGEFGCRAVARRVLSLTPSLNASLTVNTDFSATEVDDRQVNLTRFSLFFPEKRDFFLHDSDMFEFGRIGRQHATARSADGERQNGRPFFSRRLGLSPTGEPVDLEYGGKVSGRVGRFSIGTLGGAPRRVCRQSRCAERGNHRRRDVVRRPHRGATCSANRPSA